MTSGHADIIILLAEDDDGHAELILEQLRSVGVANKIIRFHDGQELWEYLTAEGQRACPASDRDLLLILDIVMPKMNGLEALRRIKTDQRWHDLPIIMLTTTNDPREIENCYKLGCNCCITKPIAYEHFTEALKKLGFCLMVTPTPVIPSQNG